MARSGASAEDDVAALAARLRRLEDLEEIRRLYLDYGHHLDHGDFAAFASLFAVDAKLRLSPRSRADGRAEVERVMTDNLGSRDHSSVIHVLGSPRIELDDDRATGEAMWSVVVRRDDGSPMLTMVGHHADDLVREDGRWRFQRRRGFLDIPAT
ncbi:MAG: hypothetical protein QOC92_4566 [Acidimicrobiaceae bacterium]|jgi:ketosteroid isomerase-like protein